MFDVLFEKCVETRSPILYFITAKDFGGIVTLKPRVPTSVSVGEDKVTPRISLSWSIVGAIKGITRIKIEDKPYFVYQLTNEPELYEPDDTEVPDVMETDEIWALSPVELKRVLEIKIDWPIGEEPTFSKL